MKRLFDAFARENKELFLVGGAVRELARGIPLEAIDDLDFCTNARPQETLEILKATGLPVYDVGIEFGTVGVVLDGTEEAGYPKDCQVTTYRSEEYYRRGSRHPQVRYGDTLMQDLKRRDFSINSIAMDADGEFIDPYDGLGDLKRGVLRVVGDPLETLAEDPLRILRVGRFIAKLGFEADEVLTDACHQRAEHILEISRERWLQEMTKLLVAAHASSGLEFLREVRILGIILPEVEALAGLHERGHVRHDDIWSHTLQVLEEAPREPALRWAALLHETGKPWTRLIEGESVNFWRHEQQAAMLFEGIAARFKLDNAMTKEVHAIIAHQDRAAGYTSDWSDEDVRRFVHEVDPYADQFIAFARASLAVRHAEARDAVHARLDELSARIAALDEAGDLRPAFPSGFGRVVIDAFSLRPSPLIGEIKDWLTEQMLAGEIASGEDAEYYIEHLRAHRPEFLADALGE